MGGYTKIWLRVAFKCTQLTFNCSKSAEEMLEKGVKNDANDEREEVCELINILSPHFAVE